MQFSSLLAALPKELAPPASMHRDLGSDPVIRGISYDSRKVAPGDLFVALVGSASDGHDYLERAITLGAVALLVQTNFQNTQNLGVAIAQVPDTRRSLAAIATRFYGEPANEVTLIGITGTNGKSTTTALVGHILEIVEMAAEVGGNIGSPALEFEPRGAGGVLALIHR